MLEMKGQDPLGWLKRAQWHVPVISASTIILSVVLCGAMVVLQSAAIGVAPLLLIILTALMARLPGAVFALYLLVPFYKAGLDGLIPFDITPVLAVSCCLLAIPHLAKSLTSQTKQSRQSLAIWTALLIVFIVGTAYSPVPSLALREVTYFLLLGFLPSLLGFRVGADRTVLMQFLWAVVAISFISTWVGFVELGQVTSDLRVASFGANPIAAGRAAILLPLMTAALWATAPMIMRVLLLFSTPIAIIVAIGSGSRGPLVMGLLTFIVVQLGLKSGKRSRITVSIISIPILFALFQLPVIQQRLPPFAVERLRSSFEDLSGSSGSTGLDTSSAARVDLWTLAWEMFQQSPIIGHGTLGAVHRIQQIPGWGDVPYTHNLPLQMAAEHGFIGLILLGSLLFVAFGNGLRLLDDPLASGAVSFALFAFFNSLVSNGIFDNRWLWGSLVIIAALTPLDSQTRGRQAHSRQASEL